MGLDKNKKVQEYLDNVCLRIKNRKSHKEIKTEFLNHIEEAFTENLSANVSENEALDRAIKQMGNAEVVGKQLNKVHKNQPDWVVLLTTIIFAGFGLLTMYFIDANGVLSNGMHVFGRSLVTALVGAAVLIGLYFFDFRKVSPYSKYIYAVSLIVLLYVICFGISVNGARRWIAIGPISINFVDISPILFIIALAGILENWNWSSTKKVIYGLILSIVPAFFIFKAPSFSTGITYTAAITILLIISGFKLRHLFLTIGIATAIAILYFKNLPYEFDRFLAFILPESYRNLCWASIQSSKLIHSAGLFGQGFTFNSSMLPEVHTEYVFSYITYTFGWAIGIILAVLVAIFLIRLAKVAIVLKNNYNKLLVSGLVGIYAVQFVWNILINLNLTPFTSVNLPFISFGGSQFIINVLGVGIITSIYRWRNISYSHSEVN